MGETDKIVPFDNEAQELSLEYHLNNLRQILPQYQVRDASLNIDDREIVEDVKSKIISIEEAILELVKILQSLPDPKAGPVSIDEEDIMRKDNRFEELRLEILSAFDYIEIEERPKYFLKYLKNREKESLRRLVENQRSRFERIRIKLNTTLFDLTKDKVEE